MSIKLPYQQTNDRQLNQFQQALSKALMPITSSPLAGVRILSQVNLYSGIINKIPHGLQSELQGWYIVRRRQFLVSNSPTAYDIYDTNSLLTQSDGTSTDTSKYLYLTCTQGSQGNPVLVDIAVF